MCSKNTVYFFRKWASILPCSSCAAVVCQYLGSETLGCKIFGVSDSNFWVIRQFVNWISTRVSLTRKTSFSKATSQTRHCSVTDVHSQITIVLTNYFGVLSASSKRPSRSACMISDQVIILFVKLARPRQKLTTAIRHTTDSQK